VTAPVLTPLTPALAYHGEGPVWDSGLGKLLWVDMLAGRVMHTGLDGSTGAVDIDDPVCALVRPLQGGGHVVAARNTVLLVDLGDPLHPPALLADLRLPPGVRCNDGAIAPDGGLYIGTMADDSAPGAGTVVHVRPDLSVHAVLTGTTVSNGTCLMDDSSVLFIDSPRRAVVRYRIAADGRWVEPEIAIDLSDWAGVPDGMCADAEGGVWIAHWDGSEVVHFDGAGVRDVTLEVATPRPTSCALGGEDGRTLFVTTSAYELADPGELAGAVLTARVGVPGRPAPVAAFDPVPVQRTTGPYPPATDVG
jgi:sugar lactone lactonase YvrE